MSWRYEQSTGKLFTPEGTLIATGYAGGNCGKNPEGINNPEMQNVKGVGPLPVGKYTHGVVVMQSQLGVFAIPLIPDPANEMHGRGGFYMHGDKIAEPRCASEGCIIMPRFVREQYYNSVDPTIEVVA